MLLQPLNCNTVVHHKGLTRFLLPCTPFAHDSPCDRYSKGVTQQMTKAFVKIETFILVCGRQWTANIFLKRQYFCMLFTLGQLKVMYRVLYLCFSLTLTKKFNWFIYFFRRKMKDSEEYLEPTQKSMMKHFLCK